MGHEAHEIGVAVAIDRCRAAQIREGFLMGEMPVGRQVLSLDASGGDVPEGGLTFCQTCGRCRMGAGRFVLAGLFTTMSANPQ